MGKSPWNLTKLIGVPYVATHFTPVFSSNHYLFSICGSFAPKKKTVQPLYILHMLTFQKNHQPSDLRQVDAEQVPRKGTTLLEPRKAGCDDPALWRFSGLVV